MALNISTRLTQTRCNNFYQRRTSRISQRAMASNPQQFLSGDTFFLDGFALRYQSSNHAAQNALADGECLQT